MTILALNKQAVWRACLESGLEVTRISGGMFMNYLALGSGREATEQGLIDDKVIWDVPAGRVEMPVKADGSAPRLMMTSLRDLGMVVAAACDLEEGRWRESMEIVGETVGIHDVTRVIEEVTGRRMEVSTVGTEELQRRVDAVEGFGGTREEIFRTMISEINLLVLEEMEGMCVLRPVANELCPHIRPMGLREIIQAAWG